MRRREIACHSMSESKPDTLNSVFYKDKLSHTERLKTVGLVKAPAARQPVLQIITRSELFEETRLNFRDQYNGAAYAHLVFTEEAKTEKNRFI